MRYRVRHATRYSYGSAVDLSYQLAHVRLIDRARQRVVSCATTIAPSCVSQGVHEDHFGNRMDFFAIVDPHDRLEIVMEGLVEIAPTALPAGAGATPWDDIARALDGDGFPAQIAVCEFAQASPMAPGDRALRDYALQSFPPGRPILDGARDLTRRIFGDFRYDPTATDVFSPLSRVMAQRAGVCQDFAHLAIAMLRSIGLAARYVSGYIRTLPPAGGAALRGVDASHAWFGVWCGEDCGWVELDPTNNLIVSDQHIVAAVGRDYSDVSPVRGVVLGGGAQHVDVAVEVRVLD